MHEHGAGAVGDAPHELDTIYELAACNPWDWFVTFTLDKNKYDRTNLPKFQKDLSQFIRDFRKKTGAQVKYMLIPEQHSY